MKSLSNNKIKTAAVLFTVLFILLFAPGISAKSGEFYSAPAEKQSFMINNLNAGIASDNEGLRRNAIYFAGSYRIAELVNSLVNQLDKEPSVRNRKLILLSLYNIGGEKAFNAIKNYVALGKDNGSKILAQCIMNESAISSTVSLSSGNE
jgi:hypothetical protein